MKLLDWHRGVAELGIQRHWVIDRFLFILFSSYFSSISLFYQILSHILFTTHITTTIQAINIVQYIYMNLIMCIHMNQANIESSCDWRLLPSQHIPMCNMRHIEQVKSRPLRTIIHIQEVMSTNWSRGMLPTPEHENT